MSLNLVLEKILGRAGIVITSCLVEKCVLLLSVGM